MIRSSIPPSSSSIGCWGTPSSLPQLGSSIISSIWGNSRKLLRGPCWATTITRIIRRDPSLWWSYGVMRGKECLRIGLSTTRIRRSLGIISRILYKSSWGRSSRSVLWMIWLILASLIASFRYIMGMRRIICLLIGQTFKGFWLISWRSTMSWGLKCCLCSLMMLWLIYRGSLGSWIFRLDMRCW